MKKVLSIALIVLLVGVLFVSCGKKEETAQAAPTPAPAAPAATETAKTPEAPKAEVAAPAPAPAAPVAEDKVVFKLVNGGEPASLDPHLIQGVPEHRIYESIFEGLIIYDPETAAGIPGIAESWDVSEDGTQYTFHLRDVSWSDGVPITAQTVVDSWLRELNPETAAPYAWFPCMFLAGAAEYNSGEAGPEAVGIRALDDRTFQMDLIGPLPYAIGALAHYSFGIVPLHAIEKYGAEWTNPENFVGNGPYTLAEWKPQSYLKVVPNETYWDAEAVQLDEVIYYPIDDNNTGYNMFINGEVDWMTTVPLDQIEAASLRRDYHRAPQLATYYYVYQTERAPFDDARVRKAFSLAVDRVELVEGVTRAGQIPAKGIVPEMAGYAGLGEPEYNVELARKLFAEAGYTKDNFPKTTILYNTSESHKAIAEFIQSQWNEAFGLNISVGDDSSSDAQIVLENQEWGTYLDNRNQGNFQVARAGWVGDYQDPNTFLDMFLTGAGMNGGKYSNEIYDILIEEAATLSGADRMDVLHEAEYIFIEEDAAIMPLYFYTTNNLIDTTKWGGWYANTMDYHPPKDIYLK